MSQSFEFLGARLRDHGVAQGRPKCATPPLPLKGGRVAAQGVAVPQTFPAGNGEKKMQSGKWGDLSFPKCEWVCEGISDLEGEREICEMCEVQEIRYVHHMVHVVAGRLDVGCVCAGNMEGSMVDARAREEYAKRRSNFVRSKRWREGAIKVGKVVFTVFPYGEQWRVRVGHPHRGSKLGNKRYATEMDGRLGVWNGLEAIKQRSAP